MSQLTVLSVIFGILASFGGFLLAIGQLIRVFRNRMIEDALNTKAIQANTAAIKEVTVELSGVIAQLADLRARMEQVENRIGA
jgi:hypothetical protein